MRRHPPHRRQESSRRPLRLVGNGMLINAGGTAAGSNIYQGRYTVIVGTPRLRGT